MDKDAQQSQPEKQNSFPPVVSVLGHVDHGKTTLLDAIRKTQVAAGETGGITQKIGSYQIEVSHDEKMRKITFIDTPGHEAFSAMRGHGVSAADIALLVIAADDGIMPQTRESIEKIRDAKIPFIVVITKTDAPGAQVERVKQQLLRENILLEGLGGDVPYIAVSAKTREKIPDLLDVILLVSDVSDIKKDEKARFVGIVIESKLDKRRGALASIIVKSGTLSVSEKVYMIGRYMGKVRALFDSSGASCETARPGDGVEILGLTDVLPAGTLLSTHETSAVSQETVSLAKESVHSLAALFREAQKDTLAVILKTETAGELEAIKNSLPEKATVIFEGQGDINVSDVMLAKDFRALVLGFNVEIGREARSLADTEHVFYKTYTVIYELLDEVEDALAALSESLKEVVLGRGEVRAIFPTPTGTIMGIRVGEGRIALGDDVRILRGGKAIGEAKIISLKHGKQDVKESPKGTECGAVLAPSLDFQVGDVVLSHK